jgi:transcriptional regulator with XRE-family HTH domain
LGALLDVQPNWLSTVLNGRAKPSQRLAEQIAEVAGVPLDEAFRGEVFS